MKKITCMLLFYILINNLFSQVYEKEIFQYKNPQTKDFFGVRVYASDSSNFMVSFTFSTSFIFPDKLRAVTVSISNNQIEQYIDIMKKYIEWYKLAELNKIVLTKTIDSIYVDRKNVVLKIEEYDRSFINCKPPILIDDKSEYIVFRCVENMFEFGRILYSFQIVPSQIEKLYSQLNHESLKKIKKDIDKSVKLLDKFK